MKELILSESELEAWKDKIVYSIKDFVEDAGATGAVMGLSGGIDSSLVATLGALAIGDRLKGLIMPESALSQEEDVKHALMIAKKLEIPYLTIELKDVLSRIKAAVPGLAGEDDRHLARANLAPRIRMIFNYALSNMEGRVVLGTGNKTELMLGYFTKYGDGGVDYLPIGGLYKTWVRQLACHLGIPDCIVDKPPSAGLWHGQTDEEELGEPYETLDKVLYTVYDRGLSEEIAAQELDMDMGCLKRITRLVTLNKHKRAQPGIPLLE